LNFGFCKKNVRFAALQFHLWHGLESDKSIPENDELLNQAINDNLTKCESGLNDFIKK